MLARLIAPAATALALGWSCAAADEYTCTSLAGDPPATATFDLRYSSNAYAVMSAAVQIGDEAPYSTVSTGLEHEVAVNGVDVSDDEITFRLMTPDYVDDVAAMHVVSLSDGNAKLTAGVLQVSGKGLWPVSCEARDEG